MNANAVAKNYGSLKPEERFRLILAASGRSDEAEADRLAAAGDRIQVSRQDHAPYAQAFLEMSWLTFIELVEDVACYFDAWERHDDATELNGDADAEGEANEGAGGGADDDAEALPSEAAPELARSDARKCPPLLAGSPQA
jgi:hypothetical protein